MESISEFVIEREIGQGGMARVYLARQRSPNRLVALKVLHEHLEGNQNAVRRFWQEKETAASLSHPSIVKVWAAYREPPPYYIAFEYLPGGTLADRLRAGVFSPHDALAILRPICDAVDYAHRCGVVHRDVKPANVMFDAHGRPVLTDFGIARAGDHTRITISGERFGTVEYMSPEQAKGIDTDHRSDLYSLAAVFYHMITGRPPFQHDDPFVTMRMIIEDPVPPLRRLAPALPPAVERAVVRGLHKHPGSRFPAASAFAHELEVALAGTPSKPLRHAPGADAMPPPAPRKVEPTRIDLNRRSQGSEDREPVPVEPPKPPPGRRDRSRRPRSRKVQRLAAMRSLPVHLRRRVALLSVIAAMIAVAFGMLALHEPTSRLGGAGPVGDGAVGVIGAGGSRQGAAGESASMYVDPGDGGGGVDTGQDQAALVVVPYLIGTSVEDAKRLLWNQGLKYREDARGKASHPDIGHGRVIWQSLESGRAASPGREVTVRLSLGPPVTIPTGLASRSFENARRALRDAGLQNVERRDERARPGMEPDTVVRVEPPEGSQVASNRRVTLYVAVARVTVPNVVGMTEAEARRRLKDAGFQVADRVDRHDHDTIRRGEVMNTDPAVGTSVRPGDAVRLAVSSGPKPRPPARETIFVTVRGEVPRDAVLYLWRGGDNHRAEEAVQDENRYEFAGWGPGRYHADVYVGETSVGQRSSTAVGAGGTGEMTVNVIRR